MVPRLNPDQTSRGVCELSQSRDDITSPADRIITIINHVRGVCILMESTRTSAVRAPIPVACIEIFHQKLIIVTAIARKADARINDLMNDGIWNFIVI